MCNINRNGCKHIHVLCYQWTYHLNEANGISIPDTEIWRLHKFQLYIIFPSHLLQLYLSVYRTLTDKNKWKREREQQIKSKHSKSINTILWIVFWLLSITIQMIQLDMNLTFSIQPNAPLPPSPSNTENINVYVVSIRIVFFFVSQTLCIHPHTHTHRWK